jgi:hypothetical protein
MDVRTDRLGLLVDQLDTSLEMARERLSDLADEEYLWEPAPGAWSLRRRGEAITGDPYGGGDWLLDWERDGPDPAPPHSIAWRVGHLYSGFSGRYDWTFGSRSLDERGVVFSPSASEALAQLWEVLARWREGVNGLADEQMDMIGFGQYPHGLDPQLPFIAIVWWTNRELIHHTAEIALLRDLYAAVMR